MNLCRICLSTSTAKDISDLQSTEHGLANNYREILAFCLDIQVGEDKQMNTKLCRKCYRKIISFYKFKTLALKNDVFLKTISFDCKVDLEEIKENRVIKSTLDYVDVFTTEAPEIKVENECDSVFGSDDELLSVIENIKQEDTCKEEYQTNDYDDDDGISSPTIDVPMVKKGRPRKSKSDKAPVKKICTVCGESVRDLSQHSKKHGVKLPGKRVPCKLCDKTFSSYSARHRHYKFRHLGVKSKCEICGKEVSNLQVHKKVIHDTENLKHQCVLCERRFICQSLLDQHIVLMHNKDKPYECDVCQKKFGTKVLMLQHKRQVHENERTHLCQYCSKSFFKKYHLQVHLRIHTKEKPYKCEECGRGFGDSSRLKNHRMTHSTEKNYQCEYCDMKFLKIAYLRVHIRTHTKEKRYPCKYCSVLFGRSDHRKRHQYTAHEQFLLAGGSVKDTATDNKLTVS